MTLWNSSKSPEAHFKQVRHVLTLVCHDGVIISLKKCKLFSSTINYLGCIIPLRQLPFQQPIIDTICNLKPPTNFTKLQSLLGLCSVCQCFVPNFVRISALPNRKWKIEQPTHFEKLTNDKLLPLQALQQKLFRSPVVAHPSSTDTFFLDTYPIGGPVGCVLLRQRPEEADKPNWIFVWIPQQRKSPSRQHAQKCPEVVWTLLYLRSYLYATDSKYDPIMTLCTVFWTFQRNQENSRAVTYVYLKFNSMLCAGIKHQAANAVLRLLTEG